VTRGAGRILLLGLVLAAGVVIALVVEPPGAADVRGWLDRQGAVGWLALTGVAGLALLAPLPRTAVSLLAGYVAGFAGGLLLAFTASLLGGLAAFGLGRHLGRDAVARRIGPRLARVDRALGDGGFLAVVAARLLPPVPFTVVSYGAGLTAVRWPPYLAGTAVGIAPGTAFYVAVGAGISAGVAWATPALAAVLVVLLAVPAVRSWRRRRARAASADA
jgi:uncharacterized membrane protein YdjX (TVP38/TMEM64 family)